MLQASRSFEHSLSAGKKKIIKQQERETKSIRSEGGNWRDKENGRGGDLREEATSSMLGVNLAMM